MQIENRDEVRSFLKGVMRTGIRIRQRRPDKFDKSTLKTIVLSLEGGILGVTGCLKGIEKSSAPPVRKIQTLIFNKEQNPYGIQLWNLKKAKIWFKSYKSGIRQIVDPERIVNKVLITQMVKSMEDTIIAKLPRVIEKALEEGK